MSPSGRTAFSLEGRPAGGLYLAAWLLSALGLALLFIAVQAGPPLGALLLIGALALILAGLSSGAGYQIVSRRARSATAFHGPSPIVLLVIQIIAVYAPLIVLSSLSILAPESSLGFLISSVTLLTGYAIVVWLFGVRSGALNLRDLGLERPFATRRTGTDIALGAGVMVLVWFVATLFAALVATLLGTDTPSVIPPIGSASDLILVAIGAALLVPIGEELFFRGYALTAWRLDIGPRKALIRSTLFFAFVHVATVTSDTFDAGARQALLVVLVIVPVGLALGWLFMRRGLVAAIAGHATFNLIGVLLLALAQEVLPPG